MKIQKRQEIEFFGTKTGNANSIALGYATETKNFGEVAVGVMNKSTAAKDPNSPKGVCVDSDATLFSVGCGGSGERKNALEVKGDGSVLISGEDGDINVADKIKQALDTDASIELVKSADSDLQYTLMVNNESRGSINIPKDQFLKNVTYDTDAKQLVFTFVTLDEEEHVERISINDLKDVYTAGDGINIDNNVISADFSSVMTAISDEKTQRETTDNEIKSTLDTKADKTELAGKFDNTSVVQELGQSEDKVISQKIVSNKLNSLSDEIIRSQSEIFRSEISVEETVENKYMLANKQIQDDPVYKAYAMDYYPVEPNKFFRIIGTASGVRVATIALLASKEATEALSVYDVSKSVDDIVNADRTLFIPEGVKYIVFSRNKQYTSKCYVVGEGESRINTLEKNSVNITEFDNLQKNIFPFTTMQKELAGAVREIYIEGIEDEEPYGTYTFSVSKRENNLQLSISKTGKVISNYYVRSTESTYDVNKKGIITLSPWGDNGKNAYMFIDFSKLEVGFDRAFPLYMPVATNLDFAPSIKATLYKTQIGTLDKKIQVSSKWYGKTLLAIGDSVTSAKKWQQRVGDILGMSVRTHAKGGIGIIQMVDGDGSGNAPDNYDPNYGTSGIIYKLNSKDVADVDVICIMGFYNERTVATANAGNDTDMYPTQSSFIGKLNYAIKRIYEELDNANNTKCKIVVVSAHKYGRNPWLDKDAYEDGNDILQATKTAANYNSLYFVDLMNGGGINKYNWKYFQNSPTDYNPLYIPRDGVNDATNKPFDSKDDFPDASTHKGYFVTLKGEVEQSSYESDGTQWVKHGHEKGRVWIGDQLHPNAAGYEKIGDIIAGHLLNI